MQIEIYICNLQKHRTRHPESVAGIFAKTECILFNNQPPPLCLHFQLDPDEMRRNFIGQARGVKESAAKN